MNLLGWVECFVCLMHLWLSVYNPTPITSDWSREINSNEQEAWHHKKRLYRQLLCNISRFKVVGSRSAPQLKHLPSWRVWMEEVLMNKVYQGQWVIAAHNSAMDMQNKQIRQPGSQTEPLRLSGIALDTGQKQSLVKAAGQH